MKNKKGFTLIELIAVIIIIGLVALIAIPFFTASFQEFRNNFYTNLSTTFLNGGKEFFADNSKYLPRRYLYSQKVSLETLVNNNYVKSFKDYKGGECDIENSYVITIKFSQKKYEYAVCLSCPGDSYENKQSPYCAADWDNDNLNITYELGTINTQYVYKGSSREALKEKLKVTLDVVKYNIAGEEIARVSGVGEEGIGVVYPSNLDTIDVNRVGEYPTEYTYQGITKTGKVIVYENGAPIVVANRNQSVKDKTKPIESNATTTDTTEYDNSTNTATPSDVWGQRIVYNMSSEAITEPGVKIAEFQWYINERWETFCKITGTDTSCSRTLETEMNETVKFRSIDSKGQIGVISRDYVVRIDKTRPSCKLTFRDPDGNNNWYRADFLIKFTSKNDTTKIIDGKNVASGLNDDNSTVLVNGTYLNATDILGRDQATQTEDNEHFVWYGYVEDKAGNWNRCYNKTDSGNTLSNVPDDDYLKKDKTPPTCEVKGDPDDNDHSSTTGVTGTYQCQDATSKCVDSSKKNFTNLKETEQYSMQDKAGNSYTCKVEICIQEQNKTDTCSSAYRCSDAGCAKYNSCPAKACGAKTCTKSCCGQTYTYSGSCSCVYGGATMSTPGCNSYVYSHGGCSGYCSRLTSYYSGSGSCDRTAHDKTCSKGSCCGYKTCRTSSCGCELYKASATKCGCESFSSGSWHNEDSCTPSHCGVSHPNSSKRVCCRDTYYLCGKRNIYITYDSEGGSACAVQRGTLNSTWGTLCTTTKTGSTFGGWYTKPNGAGARITSSSTVTGSIVVYAKWNDGYTLTYDNQGGTGCTSQSGSYGDVWGDLCVPEKDGSAFTKWTINADGTGDEITNESTVDGNLTAYAQYSNQILTISYHTNGGTYSGTNSGLAINDSIITQRGKSYCALYGYGATGINLADYNNSSYINISRTGFTPKSGNEWNTKDDGTGTSYSQTSNYTYSNLCDSEDESCDVLLYVNWEPNVYTITLDNDGATSAGTTTIYEKYQNGWYSNSGTTNEIISITKPTKTGMKSFDGYYTSSGTKIIDANGNIVVGDTTFTSNTTLYAKWTPNVLKIQYNANDNSAYWCGNSGTGYSMNSNKYAVKGGSTTFHTMNYGDTKDLWNHDNKEGICFAIDWYTADVGNEYIIHNPVNGADTIVNQTDKYSAATLASYGGCTLANGDCTITAKVNWRPSRIKINYWCNGGTLYKKDTPICHGLHPQCVATATDDGTGTPCSWRVYEQTSAAAKENGIRNHKCIDDRDGTFCLQKSGKVASINWFIGTNDPPNSTSYRLDEDKTFNTMKDLVEYCQNNSNKTYYDTLKHHDVTIDLYAAFRNP